MTSLQKAICVAGVALAIGINYSRLESLFYGPQGTRPDIPQENKSGQQYPMRADQDKERMPKQYAIQTFPEQMHYTSIDQGEYPSFESGEEFLIKGDEDEMTDLFSLFANDCVGNCLYIRNRGKNSIAKVPLKPGKKIDLYDEEMGDCFSFNGDGIWIYMFDNGSIRGWGRGFNSSANAEESMHPCDQGKRQ